MTAEELIKILDLKPLAEEGGYYRETYRSTDNEDGKSLATAILYLLPPDTFSALHRLPTDEIYHFYLGDSVEMLQLLPNGSGKNIILGQDLEKGEQIQATVPKGVWQGSKLKAGGKFALMGTTMAPGFDFADYEAADRNTLIEQYRRYKDLIVKLTKS
ncbi:MAG: cupin domain-containing protein [Patescibacteria group bacterium]